MKSPPIDVTVYKHMFPSPKPTDPQNFQSLLQRSLVPEVRLETQAFYGHLSSQEAKYPGLDYSHKPHRVRLSRYQWHRRLFRAFDNLGLTKEEIAGLTKWEGTRWAKERFEREQGIVIRDTTADEIGLWIEHDARPAVARTIDVAGVEDMGYLVEDNSQEEQNPAEGNDSGSQVEVEDDAELDSEMPSVGLELNERLRAAVAQREAGDANATIDEAWEKWFLERLESGETPSLYDIQPSLSPNAHIPGTRPEQAHFTIDETARFARWLNAGRAGQWHTIPTTAHSIVQGELNNETRRDRLSPASSLSSSNTSSPAEGILASDHVQPFRMNLSSNGTGIQNGTQFGTRQSLMAGQPPPFRGSLTRHRRTLFDRGESRNFGQAQ